MNITITGKDLKATDAIKEYAEKKLTRIEKYFAEESIDVTVTIKKLLTSFFIFEKKLMLLLYHEFTHLSIFYVNFFFCQIS